MDARVQLPSPYFFAAYDLSFVPLLFYLVSITRIHADALAMHLEVALSCVPVDTLAGLQDTDRHRRRRATGAVPFLSIGLLRDYRRLSWG